MKGRQRKLLGLGILFLLGLWGCNLCPPTSGSGEIIQVDLPSGGTIQRTVTVPLPDPGTGALGADVMWLVDLSGSFMDDLSTWKSQAEDIANALASEVSDVRFGLSSFVDAPCSSFGSAGDYGYRLELSLTRNKSNFVAAVQALSLYDGNDWPESQLEAMYQAMTGEGREVTGSCAGATIPPSEPGWISGRLRFLLVSTDATFHRPSDSGYPYPTTPDDVIRVAKDMGVRIFFLDGGGIDSEAARIASETGGSVYSVGSGSGEIVSAIRDALGSSIVSAEVKLIPVGDRGLVARIEPDKATVNLRTTREITFTVTFTDPGLSGIVYFILEVRVNGAVIANIPVAVHIR